MLYISPLKALAVDVERNLRAPLAGIANVARATGVDVTMPEIAIRTGDTPALERARFLRDPADILITTPESLFLLLTSNARERLATVDTVIIDEIHALVPGKRGAHLALSLERLEEVRRAASADAGLLQRIGLSATQRPLEEVARFLGGAEARAVRRSKPAKTKTSKTKELLPVEQVEADLHQEFRTRFADELREAIAARDVSAGHRHRRVREEGARAADRSAGRRHGPLAAPVDLPERSRRTRSSAAVDLGVGAPAAARADPHRISPRCCSSTAGGSPSGLPAR